MPRKRRVELHIERREISIFMSPAPASLNPSSGMPPASLDCLPSVAQRICPRCSSPDLILLAKAVAQPHLDLAALRHGMQAGAIHYHQSASGEWWLCSRSLPRC
jgi:hypothetical protein